MVAEIASWPNPQAWNIGAATTVVSLGPPRDPVEHRGERRRRPRPERRAPLGVPVVPEVSSTVRPGRDGLRRAGGRGARSISSSSGVHARVAVLGSSTQASTSTQPGELLPRLGEQGRELLVVHHDLGVLALEHVGELRPGEAGVQQQRVGADARRRRRAPRRAAMVAAQDAHRLGAAHSLSDSETDGRRRCARASSSDQVSVPRSSMRAVAVRSADRGEADARSWRSLPGGGSPGPSGGTCRGAAGAIMPLPSSTRSVRQQPPQPADAGAEPLIRSPGSVAGGRAR